MEARLLPGDEDEKSLDQTLYLKRPVPYPRETVTTVTEEVGMGATPGSLRDTFPETAGGERAQHQPEASPTLRPEPLTDSWGWE